MAEGLDELNRQIVQIVVIWYGTKLNGPGDLNRPNCFIAFWMV